MSDCCRRCLRIKVLQNEIMKSVISTFLILNNLIGKTKKENYYEENY